MDYQAALKKFQPSHEYFIGVDSDGCVFDTMEVKQKKFFIPNALKYFNLFPISELLRETWEFVNLYSVHRGGNRYISLIKVFELLSERVEINSQVLNLPDLTSLKEWVKCETSLSAESLRKYFESHRDPDLERIICWTEAINRDIGKLMPKTPPFPNALRAVGIINTKADLAVISQTPLEAVIREWKENKMIDYPVAIAGQEHGTKTEHIQIVSKGKYADKRILIIGDAIGDLLAARQNNVLFFPIIPGGENESWLRFIDEGIGRFLTENFSGSYEDRLVYEFKRSLPEIPPWKNKGC
jgi:phosphoglycolate phosphatase-like HAD superfamily hydrolase